MKNKLSITICVLILSLSMTGCTTSTNNSESNTDGAKLLTEVKTTQYFTKDIVSDEDIEKILKAGVNAPSAMNTQPWHFTAITDTETTQKLADAMSNMKPPSFDGKKPENAPDLPNGEKPAIPENGERPDMPKDGEKPKLPEGEKPDMPSDKGDGTGFSKDTKKAGIGDAPLTIVISCEEGQELSTGLSVQNMSAEAQLLGYGTKIMTAPTMALNGDNQAEYKELLSIPENQKFVAVLIIGKADTSNNTDAVTSPTTRKDFSEVVTTIKNQ